MYRQIIDLKTGKISERMIQRIEDASFIPINDLNSDYQKYLQWIKEGNTIQPPSTVDK